MQISSINFRQNAPVAGVSSENKTTSPMQKPESNNGKIMLGLVGLAAVGTAGILMHKPKSKNNNAVMDVESEITKSKITKDETQVARGFQRRSYGKISCLIDKFKNSIEDKTDRYIIELAQAFDEDRAKISKRMPLPPQISILSRDPNETANIVENLAELTGTRLETIALDPEKPLESFKLLDQKIKEANKHLKETGQRTLLHLQEDTQKALLERFKDLPQEQKTELENLDLFKSKPLEKGVTLVSSADEKNKVKDGRSHEVFWIYAKSAQRQAGMELTAEQIHEEAKVFKPYLNPNSVARLETLTQNINRDEAFPFIKLKNAGKSNIPSKIEIWSSEEGEKQSILSLLPTLTRTEMKCLNPNESDPRNILHEITQTMETASQDFRQKGVRTLLYIGDLDKISTEIENDYGEEIHKIFVRKLGEFIDKNPQESGMTLVYTTEDINKIPEAISKNTQCKLTGLSYAKIFGYSGATL